MEQQIRRVSFGLVVAFVIVFLQLNYLQIFAAEDIASNQANIRRRLAEYAIKRGDILTSDGRTIARSKATDNQYKYRRLYPEGDLYGHITGFYSIVFGTSRIERSYNDALLGDSGVLSMQDIQDRLFNTDDPGGDDVRLTINHELQQVARDAFGTERGAVVALEPGTGEIKAMWSHPSYDPQPLAHPRPRVERSHYRSLDPNSPLASPLLSIATSRGYPPGSTFKVLVAAAALESGKYERDSTFEDPVALELPQTDRTLRNFTRTSCAGGGQIDLFTALRVSCDTTFGILGMDLHQEILEVSEEWGFNDELPLDIGSQASLFPEIGDDAVPARAFAGIGQQDVVTTPLQMAMVAAGIANRGEVMRPRLAKEIIDPAGGIVRRFDPEVMSRPISPRTAATVRDMMVAVVKEGTGTTAQIPDIQVAGKTGTAQTSEGAAPHAWFIAFAPATDPQIAVAVIVENGGTLGSEATGAQVAAPIAKQIIEADREISNW
jgi:peptidoglycan glycosyltransferase